LNEPLPYSPDPMPDWVRQASRPDSGMNAAMAPAAVTPTIVAANRVDTSSEVDRRGTSSPLGVRARPMVEVAAGTRLTSAAAATTTKATIQPRPGGRRSRVANWRYTTSAGNARSPPRDPATRAPSTQNSAASTAVSPGTGSTGAAPKRISSAAIPTWRRASSKAAGPGNNPTINSPGATMRASSRKSAAPVMDSRAHPPAAPPRWPR
jgi:hypothetical protein